MKIKLTCSDCKSEVVYQKETPADTEKAHKELHKTDCPYKKSGGAMSHVAEFGIPLESEVLG